LELYKTLREELDDDLGFANYGGMVLIQNADELEIMERFVQQQRSYGLDVEILSKAEMRVKQPFLSERFIASTYSPMDAQADPFAVMHGFSRAGAKQNMTIVRHAPVVGIERDSHGDFVVSAAPDRTYSAPQIVNAAGTWAGLIAQMVGERIPITPKRGQIIITEKIPVVGQTNLWSAKYLVTKLDPNYQVASSDTERELGLAFAFTRSSGDSYLIGSTREYAGYDKQTTMEGIRAIIQQAVSYLPILKDVHFIRAIAGLRPSTPDGKMILGEHRNLSGFFTAAGHEGDGISLAPITGKLLAEMVCSGNVDERLSELSPNRFGKSDKEVL
jgi:sarcosine oxidase subunit beta